MVTAESSARQRVKDALANAHRTLERTEQRIREFRGEELAAARRRDYAAATAAARARMLNQERYDQALAVIIKGGRSQ